MDRVVKHKMQPAARDEFIREAILQLHKDIGFQGNLDIAVSSLNKLMIGRWSVRRDRHYDNV